jgi:uncharacterized protein YacL
LEILNELQGSREVELTVHDSTSEDVDLGADPRLVRIAKVLKARLLTNDYALSQVARLQRVAVLNLSDLTRALRPTLSPVTKSICIWSRKVASHTRLLVTCRTER